MSINEVNESWSSTSLSDILSSLESGSRPKGGVKGISEGIPSIGGEHLSSDGKFKFGNIRYVPEEFANKMSKGLIKEDDVLVVKDGATTAKVSFVDKTFPYKTAFVNEHVFICRVSEQINPKLVFWYLWSQEGQNRILANFKGSAQGGITTSFAQNTIVPLPPLNEQHRIVAKLEELFTQLDIAVAELKSAKIQIKTYKQSVLKYAFEGRLIGNNKTINQETGLPEGWEWKTLGDLADKITDGEHVTPKRTTEGYYLVSARNIQNGYLSLSNVDYIPEDEYKRIIKRCNPEFGDLLISCSGSIGRVCLVPKDLKFTMVRSVALVKLQSNKHLSKFLEYQFQSPIIQSQISKLQKATAQANLFLAPIKSIQIIIPYSKNDISEIVTDIETRFSEADNLDKTIDLSLLQAESLRQSILKKAFEGRLVPQDQNDEPAEMLLERIKEEKEQNKKVKK
jgi:type I restriction enzyme S subunit